MFETISPADHVNTDARERASFPTGHGGSANVQGCAGPHDAPAALRESGYATAAREDIPHRFDAAYERLPERCSARRERVAQPPSAVSACIYCRTPTTDGTIAHEDCCHAQRFEPV